jgi:hypothetical protein
MDEATLKARIEKADETLMKGLDSGKAAEFAFLPGFHPSSLKSRELVLDITENFSTDWSYDVLIQALQDPDESIQCRAAELLSGRARPKDGKRLLEALDQRYAKHLSHLANRELVLAAGSANDSSAIEPLLTMRNKEKDKEALEGYDMALAKVGYVKETRKLDFALEHGPAADKAKALTTLRYVNKAEWIPKVVPLLADKMTARHTSLGPATFSIRVCDEAITTLGIIDPAKKIPFEVSSIFGIPFSEKKVILAQKAYGLIK